MTDDQPHRLTVAVDRDSVCAGDDTEPHAASCSIAADASVAEMLQAARQACPLASIAGGRATWRIDVPGAGSIGVIAQQWPAPRLVVDEAMPVAQLFAGRVPALHFRYLSQVDPDDILGGLE